MKNYKCKNNFFVRPIFFISIILLGQFFTVCLPAAAAEASPLRIATGKPNNLCAPGESLNIAVSFQGDASGAAETAALEIFAVDYFGETAWRASAQAQLKQGELWRGDTSPLEPGFYWFRARLKSGEKTYNAQTSAAAIAPPRDFDKDTPFGVNFGDPELLRRAGITWVRMSISWATVEPQKGAFDFSQVDRTVDALIGNGIRILAELRTPPEWARRYPPNYKPIARGVHAGWGDFPPNDMDAFGNYVFRTVSHFKGRIKYWEVWNEPWPYSLFFIGGTIRDYVDILRIAYTRAKEADPACFVVGLGGTDHHHAELVFGEGGFPYMDLASIHIYQPGLEPERGWFRSAIRQAYDVIAQFGGGKEIWITEIGWPTNKGISEGWQGISVEDHARFLVRAQILAIAEGVKKFLWFSFRNGGEDITNFEHNQGLLFHDGAPKPSYAAYAVLTNMLRGAAFVRHIEFGDAAHAALFSDGGRWIYVVWTAGKKFPLAADAALLHRAQITSLMGKRLNPPPDPLFISDTPIYLAFTDAPSAEAFAAALK